MHILSMYFFCICCVSCANILHNLHDVVYLMACSCMLGAYNCLFEGYFLYISWYLCLFAAYLCKFCAYICILLLISFYKFVHNLDVICAYLLHIQEHIQIHIPLLQVPTACSGPFLLHSCSTSQQQHHINSLLPANTVISAGQVNLVPIQAGVGLVPGDAKIHSPLRWEYPCQLASSW